MSISAEQAFARTDEGRYDFIKLGHLRPEQRTLLQTVFGAGAGLVIEPRPPDAGHARELDHLAIDYAAAELPARRVRFVALLNALPRLEGPHRAFVVLRSAAGWARDFLHIRQSNFDDVAYLAGFGLKMFYSDWGRNRFHISTAQLEALLRRLDLTDYRLLLGGLTLESSDPYLHPLESPPDQTQYDPGRHPFKPALGLGRPVFKQVVCDVNLSGASDFLKTLPAEPEQFRKPRPPLFQAPWGSEAPARLAQLDELTSLLLLERRWAYLRYRYLRSALERIGPVGSVLSVGAGRGLAELALALEHPETRFHITDVEPSYGLGQSLAEVRKAPNVSFGPWDLTQPPGEVYDFVACVEVLEHIQDDAPAFEHLQAAAARAVFVLVPFATAADNADPALLSREWEAHRHHRVGYDEAELRRRFARLLDLQGCYWRQGGAIWRSHMNGMTDEAILKAKMDLMMWAELDDRPGIPQSREEAYGLWALAAGLARPAIESTRPRWRGDP